MNFFKKYWYLLLVTFLTVGIGVVAYLTSTKLENQQSVAPTVPQVTPKAAVSACRLVFSIAVSPTPTPTAGPSATPTSTPTPGPSATPTPTSPPGNGTPICVNLTVSPSTGVPSFTTTLTCTGQDSDGDITAVEFTLPDGSTKFVEGNVGSPGSLSTQYTISQNGTYSFSCRVRDNNFTFSSVPDVCKKTITLGPTPTPGPSPTPTSAPTPKIPVAGGPTVLGITTVAGGLLLLLLGLAL